VLADHRFINFYIIFLLLILKQAENTWTIVGHA